MVLTRPLSISIALRVPSDYPTNSSIPEHANAIPFGLLYRAYEIKSSACPASAPENCINSPVRMFNFLILLCNGSVKNTMFLSRGSNAKSPTSI